MNIAFVAALNRARIRRHLAIERERLAEMEHNAAALIGAQRERVARLEARATPSHDIARSVERRAKAAVFD